jgi:FMN phosphatase YigB (HAD superfamily)
LVCNEQNLDPSRTLFIDDTIGHIDGSIKIGLKGIHLKGDNSIEKLFE